MSNHGISVSRRYEPNDDAKLRALVALLRTPKKEKPAGSDRRALEGTEVNVQLRA